MLEFGEFIKDPRKCRPFLLAYEDEIQDREVFRRKELEDQRRQYEIYTSQFEPKEVEASTEEKRVTLQLSKLRNNSGGNGGSTSDHGRTLPGASLPVTLPKLSLRNNDKSRAVYMQKYRKKAIECPSCGHKFHSVKRV